MFLLSSEGFMQEKGRSMVEMLGVLAIIGVLSVGAMNGYSKAIFKYKLNKQAEQMNTVINAVAKYAHSFSTDFRNQNLTSYFIKLDEIPTEMIRMNVSAEIYDTFEIKWSIYSLQDGNSVEQTINLAFADASSLTKNTSQSLEICRNLIVTAKENSGNISYISTLSGYQTDEEQLGILYGDSSCRTGRACLKNVTLDQIYEICTKHIGTQSAEFKIAWRVK